MILNNYRFEIVLKFQLIRFWVFKFERRRVTISIIFHWSAYCKNFYFQTVQCFKISSCSSTSIPLKLSFFHQYSSNEGEENFVSKKFSIPPNLFFSPQIFTIWSYRRRTNQPIIDNADNDTCRHEINDQQWRDLEVITSTSWKD